MNRQEFVEYLKELSAAVAMAFVVIATTLGTVSVCKWMFYFFKGLYK